MSFSPLYQPSLRYWNSARQRHCRPSERYQNIPASLPTGRRAIRANPRGKPGFSTFENDCGRETDCLLEGDGFEPSVPRERNSLVGSIPGTFRGIERDHYEALIGEAWFAVPYKSAASGIPLSRLQEP